MNRSINLVFASVISASVKGSDERKGGVNRDDNSVKESVTVLIHV